MTRDEDLQPGQASGDGVREAEAGAAREPESQDIAESGSRDDLRVRIGYRRSGRDIVYREEWPYANARLYAAERVHAAERVYAAEWSNPHTPADSGSGQLYRQFRASRNERRAGRRIGAALLIACMLASCVSGFLGAYAYDRARAARAYGFGPELVYQSVIRRVSADDGVDGAMTMIETASFVKQVVVEITTERAMRSGRLMEYISMGAGSGVIITRDGYIVTNHHVIENARSVSVRLPSGAVFGARVIGSDIDTDLAVIRIDAVGLTPAVLGDSSALVVGQTILAVGNPLGELGGTVTAGIVSALDREITIDGQPMSLLQTDAAINPGNSGGGLFNLYGELVGIVNAKSSGSDIEGLGFSIPVNTAKRVVEDIIISGYVRGRPSAGLELLDINTARLAMMYRVNQTGLYIVSSADNRLNNGDRILAIDGEAIADLAGFRAAIRKYQVGDTISITVERGNQTISTALTLGELKP